MNLLNGWNVAIIVGIAMLIALAWEPIASLIRRRWSEMRAKAPADDRLIPSPVAEGDYPRDAFTWEDRRRASMEGFVPAALFTWKDKSKVVGMDTQMTALQCRHCLQSHRITLRDIDGGNAVEIMASADGETCYAWTNTMEELSAAASRWEVYRKGSLVEAPAPSKPTMDTVENVCRSWGVMDPGDAGPVTDEFWAGVRAELEYQDGYWGPEHDADHDPEDWHWILATLSAKIVRAQADGDTEKALHHTISSAALLHQWHAHISSGKTPSDLK